MCGHDGRGYVPIDEVVVEAEVENKSLELSLDLFSGITCFRNARLIHVRRIYRLCIHDGRLARFAE